MTPREQGCDSSVALRLALFASLISLLLMAVMLVMRTGLPTPLGALALGPAMLGVITLGPALWAHRSGGFRRQLWLGPVSALGLGIACAIAALGLAGHIVLWAAFLAMLVRTIQALRRPEVPKGGSLLAWLALLLVATLLATLMIGGSKYLNFVADQLLLYGRTDGDVMFHGAITNAVRFYFLPSTGIDGLHLLRYHTGVDILSALIAAGGNLNAVLAQMILQTAVLIPLALFGLGWGAAVFGNLLPLDPALRSLRVATAAVILGMLMQSGWVANLTYLNPPMLMSGVLLILLAPAVVIELIARREQAMLALVVAILALPILSITKISTGLIWGALTGWLVLRVIGPKRIAFWVVAVIMLALFAGCFWLANDPGQSGAILFGTPWYAARGFNLVALLTPFTVHLYLLIAVIGLASLNVGAAPSQRRLLIETLIVVAVAANLPGLVLEIPGGDAFFFLSAMNWLAAPLAVMAIAALPIGYRAATALKRGLVYGLIGIAVLEALINGATRTDDRVFTAISGAALLHTGDVTYYTDDKRKIWKADTERALKEHGLLGLYRMQPPVPTGAALAEMLTTDRATAPISLYIPPEASYWPWIKDCDGRSLWPMAAAGVPLIDGYVPNQAACEQSFALIGYGTPPATRTRLEPGDLCRRADAMGLPLVREIDSVEDRSRDRTTLCPPLTGTQP